ncbi:19418_t:CDS:2 [Gigaspora margarita]|uniref:19418_t:CDS:1 n=1 Tax=Gigaspora margarita TaxID=4874 RepID=A0ABM8VWE3_GIGMA|nr:19418_t:CDS:2 [Gigaspora margarita]
MSNGKKHLLNLFNRLINLCKKLIDNIGQEAISMYFAKAATSTTIKNKEDFNNLVKTLSAIKLGIDNSKVKKIIDNKFLFLSIEVKKDLVSSMGFKVSPEVHIININENFTWYKFFKNEKDYAYKRLSDLGLSMDLIFTFTNSDLHHGYLLNSLEPTFSIECHCFKFTLKIDKLKLAQHFKDKVDVLSSTNKNTELMLFNQLGLGGDCIAKLKVTQSGVNNYKLIMAQIKSIIFNIRTQLKIENFKNNETINTASIIMHRRNPKYYATIFNDFKSEKWLNSIKVKPAVLKTKFDKLIKDLFDSELIAIKPTNHEPFPSNCEEATNSMKPNITYLRLETLISMANGTKIAIEYFNLGDIVVGENGMLYKVLGRNEVLLGNRYLYNLSRLINPQNNTKQIHGMQDNCKILW